MTEATGAATADDTSCGGRWPYATRFFATPAGRLAYYDEGPRNARPVVLLHGNPTWSYLYRRTLPALLDAGRRAIAVDHLGFGRSDKPARAGAYAIVHHVRRLDALLDALDLTAVTLVLHDWSGPIGLRWAVRNAALVERLVVLNTFAPRLPAPMGGRAATRAVRVPGLGSLLVRRRDVLTEQFLFKAGVADPATLDDADRAAYRAPHPDAPSRTALLAFARQIPLRDRGPVAALSAENAAGLAREYTGKPVAIVWGLRDVRFGPPVLARWRELLPAAAVTTVADAAHFVQEDAPGAVTAAALGR